MVMMFDGDEAGAVMVPESACEIGKIVEAIGRSDGFQQEVAEEKSKIKGGIAIVAGFKINERRSVA